MQVLVQCFGQLSVGLLLGPVLLENVEGLPRVVVGHPAKMVRVRIPAEVEAVILAVEPGDLLAGDGP